MSVATVAHRLGIIGGGNMGSAIARGIIGRRVVRPAELVIAEIDPAKRGLLAELDCELTDDAAAAARSDHVILAIKPQMFPGVAAMITPVPAETVVMSIMAGLGSEHIRVRIGGLARMVRVMPNTPCQLGEGMTGIALGAGARLGDERFPREIFEALGRTAMLDESLMHAVTAVSGTGPAYVYFLAELMQRAAMDLGLGERDAQLLVVQTIIGAGRMLREADLEPAELRKIVTTPGGTTAAALDVMTERDLPGIFVDAVKAASRRGEELDRG